jgi:hypothetical protein
MEMPFTYEISILTAVILLKTAQRFKIVIVVVSDMYELPLRCVHRLLEYPHELIRRSTKECKDEIERCCMIVVQYRLSSRRDNG